MFAAIEILIDASARAPSCRRSRGSSGTARPRAAAAPGRATPRRPRARPAERCRRAERALLARLDLLPDGDDATPGAQL